MQLGSPRHTVLLFVLTIAILLIMRSYFPAALAIALPGSDIRPVLLLEFASQPQHLIHIFGAADDPLREARISGMNRGNALDYLLMPSYALLTLSFFTGIGRELGAGYWRIFGWLGVVAAFADAIENWLMFRMTSNMTDPLAEMAILPYPVWTKFGLLALCCCGAAIVFVRLRRWPLAALCLPAPLLLLPGMLDPLGAGPMATTMIALGWLAMAIHAASRWWGGRSVSKSSALIS